MLPRCNLQKGIWPLNQPLCHQTIVPFGFASGSPRGTPLDLQQHGDLPILDPISLNNPWETHLEPWVEALDPAISRGEAERALYPTQTENLNWSRRPPPEVKNLPEAGSAQRPHFQFLSAGKMEINWLLRKFRKKRNKLGVSLRKLGKKEINLGFPSFNPIFKLFIYFSINWRIFFCIKKKTDL